MTSNHRRKRQRSSTASSDSKAYRLGPWTAEERLLFLKAFKKHGAGNWKHMSAMVTTRSPVQIKSHAQTVLSRAKNGYNIFQELEASEREGTAPATPSTPPTEQVSVPRHVTLEIKICALDPSERTAVDVLSDMDAVENLRYSSGPSAGSLSLHRRAP